MTQSPPSWRNRLSALRPRSLYAQMAIAIAVALSAAQGVNVVVLLNGEQLSQIGRVGSLAESFCFEALTDALRNPDPAAKAGQGAPPRDASMSLETVPYDLRGVRGLRRDPALEDRAQSALRDHGVFVYDVQAGTRFATLRTGQPAADRANAAPPPPMTPVETFIALRTGPQSDWLRCRVTTLTEERSLNRRVIFGTLMLYALVLGSLLIFTRWLVMPLSRLSQAAARMGLGQSVLPVPTNGPARWGSTWMQCMRMVLNNKCAAVC